MELPLFGIRQFNNLGLKTPLQLIVKPQTYFTHSIVYVRVRRNKRPLLIPVSLNFTYFARILLLRIDSLRRLTLNPV